MIKRAQKGAEIAKRKCQEWQGENNQKDQRNPRKKLHNFFTLFQFNFVGKLLGPRGNSMKRLQEDTMTKMAVLGRGSMRSKQQVQHSVIDAISNTSSLLYLIPQYFMKLTF